MVTPEVGTAQLDASEVDIERGDDALVSGVTGEEPLNPGVTGEEATPDTKAEASGAQVHSVAGRADVGSVDETSC